jgi:hypothetical protein
MARRSTIIARMARNALPSESSMMMTTTARAAALTMTMSGTKLLHKTNKKN